MLRPTYSLEPTTQQPNNPTTQQPNESTDMLSQCDPVSLTCIEFINYIYNVFLSVSILFGWFWFEFVFPLCLKEWDGMGIALLARFNQCGFRCQRRVIGRSRIGSSFRSRYSSYFIRFSYFQTYYFFPFFLFSLFPFYFIMIFSS